MISEDIHLTPNFRIMEFLKSDIAWSDIDLRCAQLSPCRLVIENLKKVALVLQSVRDSLGIPIYVNSGYRTKALNDKLREKGYFSHPQSKHLIGRAADIRGKDAVETRRIWNWLKKHKDVDVLHSYCKTTSKSTYIHFQLKNEV